MYKNTVGGKTLLTLLLYNVSEIERENACKVETVNHEIYDRHASRIVPWLDTCSSIKMLIRKWL